MPTLEVIRVQLGTDDPRAIVRKKEALYAELDLGSADEMPFWTHPGSLGAGRLGKLSTQRDEAL